MREFACAARSVASTAAEWWTLPGVFARQRPVGEPGVDLPPLAFARSPAGLRVVVRQAFCQAGSRPTVWWCRGLSCVAPRCVSCPNPPAGVGERYWCGWCNIETSIRGVWHRLMEPIAAPVNNPADADAARRVESRGMAFWHPRWRFWIGDTGRSCWHRCGGERRVASALWSLVVAAGGLVGWWVSRPVAAGPDNSSSPIHFAGCAPTALCGGAGPAEGSFQMVREYALHC